MQRKTNPTESLLKIVRKLAVAHYKSNLSALVVFGSVGRGDHSERSDIDLLLILKKTNLSIGERIDEFFDKITKKIKLTNAYRNAYNMNYPHKLQPIILTENELKMRPPICLDLVTDAKILFDRRNFFKSEIADLKTKLNQLGAKKVKISREKWYWLLKPDIKRGEIVKL